MSTPEETPGSEAPDEVMFPADYRMLPKKTSHGTPKQVPAKAQAKGSPGKPGYLGVYSYFQKGKGK